MRRFRLFFNDTPSSVGETGVLVGERKLVAAEGIVFSDGTCCLRRSFPPPVTEFTSSIDDMLHGALAGGTVSIEYLDEVGG